MTKQDIQRKYKQVIVDWDEPSGEEFKYDIMLADGYSWVSPQTDRQCRTIETFETLAQVSNALRHVVRATPEDCAVCRFFKNGICTH